MRNAVSHTLYNAVSHTLYNAKSKNTVRHSVYDLGKRKTNNFF